jgi:CDP-diacylglycerol--glycerol-3-phosphate 3-phosphatidyltransferase
MANLITVGRLLLLFVLVGFIYVEPVALAAVSMLGIAVVFVGDGIDGWVARRRGSTSPFGAVFDIAGDRIVETALWIVFADLGAVPIWVPLLVVTRGSVVDALRSLSYAEGMTAFGERNMMRSALTRWLTAGRFMRALYGYAKAVAFFFLTGLVGYRAALADGHDSWLVSVYGQDWLRAFGWLTVWGSVALTVIRGIPVVVDALPYLARPDRRDPRPETPPVAGARPPEPTRAPGPRG